MWKMSGCFRWGFDVFLFWIHRALRRQWIWSLLIWHDVTRLCYNIWPVISWRMGCWFGQCGRWHSEPRASRNRGSTLLLWVVELTSISFNRNKYTWKWKQSIITATDIRVHLANAGDRCGKSHLAFVQDLIWFLWFDLIPKQKDSYPSLLTYCIQSSQPTV